MQRTGLWHEKDLWSVFSNGDGLGREPAAAFLSEGVGYAALCSHALARQKAAGVSSPFPHFLCVTAGRGKVQRGNRKWSGLPSLSKQQNGLQVQLACFQRASCISACPSAGEVSLLGRPLGNATFPPLSAIPPPPPSPAEADLCCLLVVPSY